MQKKFEATLNTFVEMRNNKELCDVTFRTKEGSEFYVHGLILAICSPYFDSKIERNLKLIELPDISDNIFVSIMDYAYSVKTHIDEDNVKELLETSAKYEIEGIKNNCCACLLKNINIYNCIETYRLCDFYGYKEDISFKFILNNYTGIVEKNENFLLLSPSELEKFISSKYLNVANESIVVKSIFKWINHDQEIRKSYMENLIFHAGLANLDDSETLSEIYHAINNQKHSKQLQNILPLIQEAKEIFYNQLKRKDLYRVIFRQDSIWVLGGWGIEGPMNVVETYSFVYNTWRMLPEATMLYPRAHHKCIAVNANIFVIGGYDGNSVLNSCHRLNVESKKWEEMEDMMIGRCYLAIAVYKFDIYVMGGYDGHQKLRSVEKYNIETNKWQPISSMNEYRSDCSAAFLDTQIYVVGGINNEMCLSSVERYDIEKYQWTFIQPLNYARSGMACISYGSEIYVIGGFDGTKRLSIFQKYNPKDEIWISLCDMNSSKSHMSVEVIEDKIYVLGGYNGENIISDVVYYDIKKNKWHEVCKLIEEKSAIGTCIVSKFLDRSGNMIY